MFKKFLSVILSISMLLSMVSFANVFAATSDFITLDLSAVTDGSAHTHQTTTGLKAFYTTVDNKTCVAIGPRNTDFTTAGGTTGKILEYANFKNSNGLPSGTVGINLKSTFKLTNTAQTWLTSTSEIRYIDLYGGNVRTCDTSNSATNTGLTYSKDTWYTINFALNYTTGYYTIDLTNLSTNETKSVTGTRSEWIADSSAITNVKTFKFQKPSNATTGYMYISAFEVKAENNADAIAPSRMVVRDDFDSKTSVISPWAQTTSGKIITTDRGNSVKIGSDGTQQLYIKNTSGVLPTTAKGLVSEFSVKMDGTKKAGMIFNLSKASGSSNAYWTANSNLIKFETDNDIVFFGGLLENGFKWKNDVWYDVRIEIDFTNKNIRHIIYDGTIERVYNNSYTHTLFDDLSLNTYLAFTAETDNVDGADYIDNVNVYWLDSASALGISKEYASNPVNINFESYAVGTEAITNDLSCTTPMIGYSSSVAYEIESVKNSGRGKSLKITTSDAASHTLHKDTTPIQNGSYSFDIMVPAIDGQNDGIAIIDAQVATASNGQSTTKDLLRFSNWGYITDGGNNNICTYEAGKWYKVILTAGSDASTSNGQVNTKVYDENGNNLVDKTVSFGSYNDGTNLIPRDSIQYARIEMIQNPNTIYIDNYKAYKPSATPSGIYPVNQSALKESEIYFKNKIILPFSKPVDLTKSVFEVNGEEVNASGYEIITLGTSLEEGEEYTVEYTVYDLDGFKTEGYISGISCEGMYTYATVTKATKENPTATASVTVSKYAGSRDVKLYVAAYCDGEMIALNVDPKTLTSETGSFTATVDATGADEIKTFLWDGETLTPIK